MCLIRAGYDCTKENVVAGAAAGVKRHGGDEGVRHSGSDKFAAQLKTFFDAARCETDLVMRDGGSTDIFVEEPLHGAATLDIHFRSHDGFDFALELSGGKSFLGVFDDEGFQESHEAGIGIWGIGLTQHFTEHVHNPSTLAVDHLVVSGGRFGGKEAQAHDE